MKKKKFVEELIEHIDQMCSTKEFYSVENVRLTPEKQTFICDVVFEKDTYFSVPLYFHIMYIQTRGSKLIITLYRE